MSTATKNVLPCYVTATCCLGTDCTWLNRYPDQPCWGQVEVANEVATPDGGYIWQHCCRGHADADIGRPYIPKN